MAPTFRSLDDLLRSSALHKLIEPLDSAALLDQSFRTLIPAPFSSLIHVIRRHKNTLIIACTHTAALSQGRFLAQQWLNLLNNHPQFAEITELKFVLHRTLKSENLSQRRQALQKKNLPDTCRQILLDAAEGIDDEEISLIWHEMATRRPE